MHPPFLFWIKSSWERLTHSINSDYGDNARSILDLFVYIFFETPRTTYRNLHTPTPPHAYMAHMMGGGELEIEQLINYDMVISAKEY